MNLSIEREQERRDNLRLAGVLAVISSLASQRRGNDAFQLLGQILPYASDPSTTLTRSTRLQVARLEARLRIWVLNDPQGRTAMLDVYKQANDPTMPLSLADDDASRLIRELANDLSGTGHVNESVQLEEALVRAAPTERLKTIRSITLAGFKIGRAFQWQCEGRIDDAVTEYERAQEDLEQAVAIAETWHQADALRWGAPIRNARSYLTRSRLLLAVHRSDCEALDELLSSAQQLLRDTMRSGQAPMAIVARRTGRVGAIHLRSATLTLEGPELERRIRQRAVPLLSWDWHSMKDGYIYSGSSIDYIEALQAGGEVEEARQACSEAISRLELQAGHEYPAARYLRRLSSEL